VGTNAADAVWELEGPVPGQPSLALGRFDLARHGYVVEELFLRGTASSYREGTDGGEPEAAESETYRTRLLVARPVTADRFGGTAVVEWLNVSGGGDGAPDWMFLHRHILRTGAAWIGVSAQKVGVEGGGRMGNALGGMKQANPDRYGSLAHPGDAFAFDIYSHAGVAVRSDPRVLGGATPRTVIAVGESQSAMFLVGYINHVDPIAQVYDAFLVHGRGGRAAGLRRASDESQPRAATGDPILAPRVPTITVQSETDVIGMQGFQARCDDSATARFWEIAGAAHFDTWGLLVSQEDDGTVPPERLAELGAANGSPMGMPVEEPINSGPQQHYVLQAALAHLERWAGGGEPAPRAPRLETTTDAEQTTLVLDDLGLARGGIRTPWVDVPVAQLSGLGAKGEGFSFLFGVTRPFDADRLGQLYPGGRDEYLERFAASAETARAAGFLLDDDIDEILGIARASWPG
jgi:hypothetical protein